MTYATLMEQSRLAGLQAARFAEQAEAEKMQETKKDLTMRSWIDYNFDSSSGLTEEFALFARQFRTYITRALKIKQNLKLISFNRGHFEVSGFIQNTMTQKFVYFSSSDVRHFSNSWYEDLLIRTAAHEKDFTGGSNCSTALPALADKAEAMTA